MEKCPINWKDDSKMTCSNIQNYEECHKNDNFIDYLDYIFCQNKRESSVEPTVRLASIILFLAFLFVILSTIVDRYFCPLLTYVSNKLKLDDSLAGATLLAFGNSSPDFFTSFSSYKGDTVMTYAQLYGGDLFIIGFVSAFIFLVYPFQMDIYSTIRDLTFYIIACLWIAFAFRDDHFTYFEAIGAICIYVFYLAFLVFQFIRSKPNELTSVAKNDIPSGAKDMNVFRSFLDCLNPIDQNEWSESGFLMKIIQIIQAPICVILSLAIPAIKEDHPLLGWNKMLNSIQIVLLPIFSVTITASFAVFNWRDDFGIPYFAYFVFLTVIIAVLVFLFAEKNKTPILFVVLASLGSFIGSILVISSCASEIVAILSTLGVIMKISESMLAISVLTWGNGVGDLVSNLSLAKKGKQKMAIAACFGSPIFNSLFNMGVLFTARLVYAKNHLDAGKVTAGDIGPNCSYYLFLLLIFIIFFIATLNFHGRRIIGIFALSVYFSCLLFCLLSELHIVHPYGIDHRSSNNV